MVFDNKLKKRGKNMKKIINLICRCVGLGMGVAVVVLNILEKLNINTAITMLGIGLFAIALSLIESKEEK